MGIISCNLHNWSDYECATIFFPEQIRKFYHLLILHIYYLPFLRKRSFVPKSRYLYKHFHWPNGFLNPPAIPRARRSPPAVSNCKLNPSLDPSKIHFNETLMPLHTYMYVTYLSAEVAGRHAPAAASRQWIRRHERRALSLSRAASCACHWGRERRAHAGLARRIATPFLISLGPATPGLAHSRAGSAGVLLFRREIYLFCRGNRSFILVCIKVE